MRISDKCKAIKLFLTDVDGVLTEGGIIYDSNGVEQKRFNVKDGLICSHLTAENIRLGIITGRSSQIVEKRFQELKFDFLHQGIENKLSSLREILEVEGLNFDEVAYIGDDLNDLEIIKIVGLSAAPNDAVDAVQKAADYVCSRNGGHGCFREFADFILSNR